ncbi:MAG: hypothetical protein ABGW99_09485 [Zunongwangia sp.]|uniref:hypothetical protein n=1 Tax=Zunongwangia sp. TaxID=1965325 RepID=UPI003242B587|tara:strand:- start:325 stop:999 length:675 start_codon:yes stop_codon:yes gene_type:complete
MKKIVIILIFGFVCHNIYSQDQKHFLTSNEDLIYELLPAIVDFMYRDFRLPIPLPPPMPGLSKKDSLEYSRKIDESWEHYYSERERLKNLPTKIFIGIADTIAKVENSHIKLFKKEFNVAIDSFSLNYNSRKPINLERIKNQDKFNFKLASFYLNKDEIWQNKGENLFMGIVSISNIIFDKTGSYGIFTATYGCGKLCGHCTRFYLKKVNGIWEIIQTKVYCVS